MLSEDLKKYMNEYEVIDQEGKQHRFFACWSKIYSEEPGLIIYFDADDAFVAQFYKPQSTKIINRRKE